MKSKGSYADVAGQYPVPRWIRGITNLPKKGGYRTVLLIQSNGSKWVGEAQDTIDVLLDRLKSETLDPTFEDYGNFFYRLPGGEEFHAFGSFLGSASHFFSLFGGLDEMLPLAQALKQARRKRSYLVARAYLRGKGAVSTDSGDKDGDAMMTHKVKTFQAIEAREDEGK